MSEEEKEREDARRARRAMWNILMPPGEDVIVGEACRFGVGVEFAGLAGPINRANAAIMRETLTRIEAHHDAGGTDEQVW